MDFRPGTRQREGFLPRARGRTKMSADQDRDAHGAFIQLATRRGSQPKKEPGAAWCGRPRAGMGDMRWCLVAEGEVVLEFAPFKTAFDDTLAFFVQFRVLKLAELLVEELL